MDAIDVINRIADKKKLPQREGKVVAIHPTHLMIQPKGSTRLIPCDFNGGQPVDIGQWCTYLRTGKRYVISAIMDKPNTMALSVQVPNKVGAKDSSLHTNIGGEILRIRSKAVPAEDDVIMINDSEDGYRPKSLRLEELMGGGGSSGLIFLQSGLVDLVDSTTETSMFPSIVQVPIGVLDGTKTLAGKEYFYLQSVGGSNITLSLYLDGILCNQVSFTVGTVSHGMWMDWYIYCYGTPSAANFTSFMTVYAPNGDNTVTTYSLLNGGDPIDTTDEIPVDITAQWSVADPLMEIISFRGSYVEVK